MGTKIPTRSYIDRVHSNTIDKVQAKDDLKKENERVEKASGSRDIQIMVKIILNQLSNQKERQEDHQNI